MGNRVKFRYRAMTMRTRFSSSWLGLSLVMAAAQFAGCSSKPAATSKPAPAPPPPEEPRVVETGHRVVINRPVQVGFKYRLLSTGSRDVKLEMDGKLLPQSAVTTWELETTAVVKAVSSRGRAIEEEHTIVKLDIVLNGKKVTFLPGKVIRASLDGRKQVFVIDGAPVTKPFAEALNAAIDLDKGELDDDAIFGTTERKRVGDRWSVNRERLVKSWHERFQGSAMPIEIRNVAGSVELRAAKTIEGVSVLVFGVALTIKSAVPHMAPVVPRSGEMQVQMEQWLPRDPGSLAARGGTKKMRMHVTGELAQGAKTSQIVLRMLQEENTKRIAIQ